MGATAQGLTALHDAAVSFYPIHDHGLLDVVKVVVVAWLRVSEGRKPASTGALPSFDYA
jgi:hypothetical protein